MDGTLMFQSLNDLYAHILPALKSKTKELHKNGYKYIHEEDIWNYLKKYKWRTSRDLDLGIMVNDIFSIELKELDDYVREELQKYHRDIKEGEA